MPDAVCISDPPWRLSPRRAWLPNARGSSWRVLRRLLLGTDGVIAGWRRDERALDCPARVLHSSGEGRSIWTPDRSRCWRSPRRGRYVVILDGNVLTVVAPELE